MSYETYKTWSHQYHQRKAAVNFRYFCIILCKKKISFLFLIYNIILVSNFSSFSISNSYKIHFLPSFLPFVFWSFHWITATALWLDSLSPLPYVLLVLEPNFATYKANPGGTNGKEPTCQYRRHKDVDSVTESGRSSGVGHGNPLQYSCL